MAEKKRFQKQKLNKKEIKEKEKKAGILRKVGQGAAGAVVVGAGYVVKKAGPAVVKNAPKAVAVVRNIIKL